MAYFMWFFEVPFEERLFSRVDRILETVDPNIFRKVADTPCIWVFTAEGIDIILYLPL